MFASSLRLDLGFVVGPTKPDDIETILSGPLPIFIEFKKMLEVTSSALERMRAVLDQRDRVRGISFEGKRVWMDEVFSATNCNFPILDSVVLRSLEGVSLALDIMGIWSSQTHFLGGQICQICIYDALHWSAFPSHPYPGFYRSHQPSPISLYKLTPYLVHHERRPSWPICKAYPACAV